MTQEEFIQGGIKLIGFYFLIVGCLALVSGTSSALWAYHYLKTNAVASGLHPFGVTMHGTPDTPESDVVSQAHAAVQWSLSHTKILVALAQLVFGLYLARGGKLVLKLLMGKDKGDAQPVPDVRQ